MWHVWDGLADSDNVSYTILRILGVIAITRFTNWSGCTAWLTETYNKLEKATQEEQTEEEDSADGVAGGVANGVAGGAATGVAGGVANGVAGGAGAGVAGGVANGVAGGAAAGVPSGVANGVAGGAAAGIPGGVANGVAGGAAAGIPGGVADGSADDSAVSPRNVTETTTTNSSKSIKHSMIIAAKMIIEMLQKLFIMISLIILTENTLKQWLCEPFLSIVQLEELRSIPKITKKIYEIICRKEEPKKQGPELGEVNGNQDPRPMEVPRDLPVPPPA